MRAPGPSRTPQIGILMTDAVIQRPAGDVGNPATFPFAPLYERVAGASLDRLIRLKDPGLLAPFVAAGQRLAARGARAVTSTCGFLILFQSELAAALPVPVFTSSLLQLPMILSALAPTRRVGVLTAHGASLTDDLLRRAGADPLRLALMGLESQPHFADAIFGGSGCLDQAGVAAEVVGAAQQLAAREPDLGALLLECANLPPYAAAVQAATGLPVFDFNSMIAQIAAALAPVRYPIVPERLK